MQKEHKTSPFSSTATKSAKASDQGPLPGKGPWVRVDDVWYTQDEAGEWVIMPGQPKAKGLKRLKPVDVPS